MRFQRHCLGIAVLVLMLASAGSILMKSSSPGEQASSRVSKQESSVPAVMHSPNVDDNPPEAGAQATFGSARMASAPSTPEAYFAEVEALVRQGDQRALGQLGALISLCARLPSGVDANPGRARFQAPLWQGWAQACQSRDSASWLSLIQSHASVSSSEAQTLASLPLDDASVEQLERRDRILEELLARTEDAEIGAAAAYVYLDRERQLAWAQGEIPNALQSAEGSESFRLDASIEFACRMGRDCSPHSPYVLAECAHTAGCLPGVTMRQILEMRRSPQELQLIDTLLGRLLELRGGGH